MAVSNLRELYLTEKLSIPDIANRLGWPRSRVRTRLLEQGIPLRSRAEGMLLTVHKIADSLRGRSRPPFSDEWKRNMSLGRRRWAEQHACRVRLTSKGYLAFEYGIHKGRLIHDVLMENIIGRRLLPGEIVHHLDENKTYNVRSNFLLVSRAEHTRLHRLAEIRNGKIRARSANGRFV
jgi:hypothetical protein